jgi:hypothetical protein
MRERFDDQEWELLRHLVYSAFSFAMGADDKIEPSELAAVADTINHPDTIEDPLHSELALDYKTRGDAGIQEEQSFQGSEDDAAAFSRVMRTKGFLKDKLTAAEYEQFLTSLFVHCGVTDLHRKKHLFGRHPDERLSKEDAEFLGKWAAIWDLDPAALARFTGS